MSTKRRHTIGNSPLQERLDGSCMMKTKKQAIDFIYSSYNQAKQFADGEMQRIQKLSRELLNAVGAPDNEKQIILVTGSKGKGSTASFIASLLQALGFTTGLFTSPHYESFNERIQVDGDQISDRDFIRLANEVAPHASRIMSQLEPNCYLGPIAINLAIACLYFSEKQVNFIILEAGKGGRDDDTNVVNNQWAVLTPILDEHIDELGPTLEEIVKHKLGIIKNASSVFISKQEQDTWTKISQNLATGALTFAYEKDFLIQKVTNTPAGTTFNLQTTHSVYENLFVPLLGTFQCENVALAVQTCESIIEREIEKMMIQSWLRQLRNPGKCEVISNDPLIIADATIHRHSAAYVHEVIASFSPKNIATIFGLSNDKDLHGVVNTLLPITDYFFFARPETAYKSFSMQTSVLRIQVLSLHEALSSALDINNKSTLFLVVGNHSFIAEVKEWINHHLFTPVRIK